MSALPDLLSASSCSAFFPPPKNPSSTPPAWSWRAPDTRNQEQPVPSDHNANDKESAIAIRDEAVERPARQLVVPKASPLHPLIAQLALKRLVDGQFGERELTLRRRD